MCIKALGYICIESTEPWLWQSFMAEVVGFSPSAEPCIDGSLFFRMDAYSWRLQISPGQQNKVACAGWEVEDETALAQLMQQLQAYNIPFTEGSREECQHRRVRAFISLHDPSGARVEIFHHMKLDYQRLNSPAGVSEFVTGYNGDMGLGHYVIPTSNFAETLHFYTEILGFGKTDFMEFNFPGKEQSQGLHFLHVDNPRHHSLALFEDPEPAENGCVHLMFEVCNIDEVGYFMDRCAQHKIPIVYGLGRHTNDRMLSVYVQSPAGFAIEYGCDGVQLDWENYKPTESSSPSLWGHNWDL